MPPNGSPEQTLPVSMPRIPQLNFFRVPLLIFSPAQGVSCRLPRWVSFGVSYPGDGWDDEDVETHDV
jgi:hypothetical protein